MKFSRGTIRRVAAIWLMLQMAWLTALVPRDCCAAHRPTGSGDAKCHSQGPAAQCPMRAANGTACPMHSGAAGHGAHGQDPAAEHDPQSPTPSSECALRGVCAGPMAALLVLLANHGILPESTTAVPDVAVRSITSVVGEHVAGDRVPPDPPPPRA
jgi:hypothetical protein